MAFCSKCGSSISDGVAFCPQCGAPTGPVMGGPAVAPATGPSVGPVVTPMAGGLSENVAGLLCYLLGWLTGIIFLLIDKRPFVRFHAAQSIVVFGALFIFRIILSFGLFGIHMFGFFSLWALVSMLLGLVTLVLWIVLMVTAFQGKRLEIPVAAPLAKSIAGNPSL
jgi:uncharacterized membrane protein